jgi:predicted nucleic acid-binding Zn ribbon protein
MLNTTNNNPTLIPCPVCKKEVSNNALTCPHCGTQLNKSWGRKSAEGLAIMYIIFVILGFIISFIFLSK